MLFLEQQWQHYCHYIRNSDNGQRKAVVHSNNILQTVAVMSWNLDEVARNVTAGDVKPTS